MGSYIRRALAAAMLFALAPLATQAAEAGRARPRCDEACLSQVLDGYLTALATKDPFAAPFDSQVRFSENSVMLEPGDGLWGTISRLDRTRGVAWFDPQDGQIGYMGLVEEHGLGAYLAARLKVRDGKITELETMVNRKEPGPRLDPAQYKPDPMLAEVLPPAQRTSREQMIKLADGYFSTLDLNDGKIFTVFDPGCQRAENGLLTAAPKPSADRPTLSTCSRQLELGELKRITGARARQYFAIDETRGLILSRVFLDHSGVLAEYPRTDGTIMKADPHFVPQSWCVLEAFKIASGRIIRIQAVMAGCPYKMPTPWPGQYR
jgi:hypothetical protein